MDFECPNSRMEKIMTNQNWETANNLGYFVQATNQIKYTLCSKYSPGKGSTNRY